MGNFPSACLSTNRLVHNAGEEETIKVVRLPDGKVFEYDGPVYVKNLLFGFEGLAVFHSSNMNRPLSAQVELKFGHIYYVKPWQSHGEMDYSSIRRVEAKTASGKPESDLKKEKRTHRVRFLLEDEYSAKFVAPEPFQASISQLDPKMEFFPQQQNGVFRVKLMISKKDLAEILSTEERVDALVQKLIAPLIARKEAADIETEGNAGSWKPSLESIPEAQSARLTEPFEKMERGI